MLDMDEQRASWTEYFEQLYMMNPMSGLLPNARLHIKNADPSVDEIASSLDDVKEAVA